MTTSDRSAPTSAEVLESIRLRWSPLAFDARTIEPEKIRLLFEAARWALSSYNEQPWRYIYALKDDGEDRAKLEALLVEGNAWAKSAPLLMISFASKTFLRNGTENRYALHDTGCASGFITLQAVKLGLATHQMSGFRVEDANAELGVPDAFLPGSMMAVGYMGNPASLPDSLRERELAPRQRKEQTELVMRGRWTGQSVTRDQ